MRAGWHLPLLAYGHPPWYDLIFIAFAFQLMITWLYNRTSGSVLLAMVFHLASNVVAGGVMFLLFADADWRRCYAIFVGLACLAAAIIIRMAGANLGRAAASPASRPNSQGETQSTQGAPL